MENNSTQLSTQTISPADREKAMRTAKAEVAKRRRIVVPSLCLANGSDVEGVEPGEFYVKFKEENASGDYIERRINIGSTPQMVILKRTYTYSWFSQTANNGDGKLMAWTNEIESFQNMKDDGTPQDVVLVNSEGEEPKIAYHGNYSGFKEIKETYRDRDGKQLLRFRNALYVYLPIPGEERNVFRFFTNNSSVSGVDKNGEVASFKNPEPKSLISCIEGMQRSEAGVMFGTKVRLSSRKITGKKVEYYIAMFEDAGPVEDIDAMCDLYIGVNNYLNTVFESDFGSLSMNTSAREASPSITVVDLEPHEVEPDERA